VTPSRESRGAALRRLEELRAPAGLSADVTLDTVGLYCPVPILKTAARIVSMDPGQVLEVLSDDRVILLDMPAWCLSTGHSYLGFREEPGEWRLFVKKMI
jgi:tRNA 2-thiouridine synthesizing protein A